MNCDASKPLLHAYLDSELGVASTLDFERHLKECQACSRACQQQQALRLAIAGQPLRFTAPPALETQVRSAVRRAAKAEEPRWRWRRGWAWNWPSLLAPLATGALVLAICLPFIARNSPGNRLAGDILSSHLRSLLANNLTDVASSDQHTVKPWFNGKLPFSPPVPDLAAEGFPLMGGRLDYVGQQPVAAIVYQRRKHYINVFIWPSTANATATEQALSRRGYNLIHWTAAGMDCWAVSDVNKGDLQRFVDRLRTTVAPRP